MGLGDGTREKSNVGGLLRDAWDCSHSQAGILQIPAPAKAEPSPGRRWEENLLLPHFCWGLFFTKPTSTGSCRSLGKVPQSSPLLRASPFSTRWINPGPKNKGCKTARNCCFTFLCLLELGAELCQSPFVFPTAYTMCKSLLPGI